MLAQVLGIGVPVAPGGVIEKVDRPPAAQVRQSAAVACLAQDADLARRESES